MQMVLEAEGAEGEGGGGDGPCVHVDKTRRIDDDGRRQPSPAGDAADSPNMAEGECRKIKFRRALIDRQLGAPRLSGAKPDSRARAGDGGAPRAVSQPADASPATPMDFGPPGRGGPVENGFGSRGRPVKGWAAP